MKRILLTLSLFAPLLAACSKKPEAQSNRPVVYADPKGSFSCAIPGEWKVDESALRGSVPTLAFYGPSSGPHPYSAIIRIEHYLKGADPLNNSPQQYVQNAQSAAKLSGDTMALFFPEPYPWNGQSGFHFKTIETVPKMDHAWDGKEEASGNGSSKLRDEEVVLPASDGFYVLSYISDPKSDANEEAVFRNVLETFKIKK